MRWLVTTLKAGSTTTRRYLDWLGTGGVESVVADAGHPEPSDAASCAALLLSGGGDLDPARYDQPTRCTLSHPNPDRDRMEFDWIRRFRAHGRPVFGICRGLQVLWAALGGRLIQHVPDAPGLADEPHGAGEDDVMHGIRWTEGARMARVCRSATTVNSHHHQAADPAHPAAGLRIAATSPAGVIEALESVGGPPVSAVQWHPERLLPRDHPARAALLRHWIALARPAP